ncbi:MAG: hypothetical protein EOM12_13415 [Verrucomicrobiae bacterium]|nr:hypothetical protein [Verrucomicrobiae bacterium]
MNLNNISEVARRPDLMAMIATAVNPVTIGPLLALGAVGITGVVVVKAVKKLKSENKRLLEDKKVLMEELEDCAYEGEYEMIEDDEDEPYEEAVISGSEAVKSTVQATVGATVPQLLNSTVSNGSNTVETMTDEELRKEMIRQAMSELGKRSAAARARKKCS